MFGVLIIYNFDCTAGVSWLLAQKYYIEKCSLLARYWGTDGTTRIFHSAVQFLKSESAQISIRCPGFLDFFYSFCKPTVLRSSSKILEIHDLKIHGPHGYQSCSRIITCHQSNQQQVGHIASLCSGGQNQITMNWVWCARQFVWLFLGRGSCTTHYR